MFRRMAAMAAMLALLFGAARAEGLYCVVEPPVAALVDADGVDRIANGLYADLFAVREGELYAAGEPGDYRLCDAWGRVLSEMRFAMICDEGDALVFRAGGRYGAMDARGRVVVEAEWTQLAANGEGGFLALDGDPLDDLADEIICVEPGAAPRRTGVSTVCGLAAVNDGRMPYMAPGGRCGAVDARGAIAVAPVWLYVGAFRDGLAEAEGEFGRGLIDADGAIVVEAAYDRISRGDDLIAARTRNGKIDVYAPNGEPRYSLEGDGWQMSVVGDCLAASNAASSRLYGARGELLAMASPDAVFFAGTGGQVIVADGAYGSKCQRLLDPDGGEAAGPYQRILPLCPGRYAYLTMRGAVYYSEDLGRLQTSWDYDSVRYGLLDAGGREMTAAEYLEIRALGGDRLLMVTAEEIRLTDLDGAAIRAWPAAEAPAASG